MSCQQPTQIGFPDLNIGQSSGYVLNVVIVVVDDTFVLSSGLFDIYIDRKTMYLYMISKIHNRCVYYVFMIYKLWYIFMLYNQCNKHRIARKNLYTIDNAAFS